MRPEDVSGLQERIDAYVLQLAEEAAAKIEGGIDKHLDEDNDANSGLLAAAIVGAVMLFVLIGLVIYKIIKQAKDKKAKIEQKAFANN